jgi:hypothetical protein
MVNNLARTKALMLSYYYIQLATTTLLTFLIVNLAEMKPQFFLMAFACSHLLLEPKFTGFFSPLQDPAKMASEERLSDEGMERRKPKGIVSPLSINASLLGESDQVL